MRNNFSARSIFYSAVLLGLACLSAVAAHAQESVPFTPDRPGTNPADQLVMGSPVNVYVNVRELNGLPLEQSATVTLNCPLAGVKLSGPTKGSSQVQFNNIPAGDCNVEVASDGFKPAKDRVIVTESMTARNEQVFVYLHPASESATTSSVRPVINPSMLTEMDKGSQSMRKDKLDDARKHFDKALRISPNNPDVLYLTGVLDMHQQNLESARQEFERAISIYPTHQRSLIALGEVQVKLKQYGAAATTMEQLLQQDSSSWRAHLIAASAYAQQGELPKAESQAQQAATLGGANAGSAKVLLAQILAAQGNRKGAREEYEETIQKYGNDPSAVAAAKVGLASLEKLPDGGAASRPTVTSELPASLSTTSMKIWAPPDVDAVTPAVLPDVSCSESDVISQATLAAKRQFENFERFVATEHIEHEEIGRDGESSHLRTRDFNYMVFVEPDKKDKQLYLDEKRDGGTGIDDFPTPLATIGLIGLGVDVFQPGFARALQFRCEGLGQWRGKAAWIIHFVQKPEARSFLRLWQTKLRTVEVPLKGRVWVAANSYDVLHIETDLRDPMKDLELTKDHISVDYGPVEFNKGQTQLWLPWSAEIFLDLHGRQFHHKHTLSNYAVFGVDTNNKISRPKDAPPEEPEQTPTPH